MVQPGQVFKLRTRGADGKAVWAFRYRPDGRGSARPQVGGFASRAEARRALAKVLERLGPGGRAASVTSPPPGRTRPGVAEITYVPTHEGWLFLAAVMDLTRARSSAGA
jgi:hypothetical protein